jgi:hypothetical protein
VRLLQDGRVLVHCFSGCGAADVIGAVGLEYADLFPELVDHRYAPVRQPFSASDALRCLASESGIIAVAVADIADGRPLNNTDAERVALAWDRLQTALGYVHGHS